MTNQKKDFYISLSILVRALANVKDVFVTSHLGKGEGERFRGGGERTDTRQERASIFLNR
jgi:hypothetical protein